MVWYQHWESLWVRRDAISFLIAWNIKFRQGNTFCPCKTPGILNKWPWVYEWQGEAEVLSVEEVELFLLPLRTRRSFKIPRVLLVTASEMQLLRNDNTALTTAWPPGFSLQVLRSWIIKVFLEVKSFLGLLLWRKPLKWQSREQMMASTLLSAKFWI